MNGKQDGTQGQDSGADLHEGAVAESPPTACTWSGLWNVRNRA